jgi:hypothetical protein
LLSRWRLWNDATGAQIVTRGAVTVSLENYTIPAAMRNLRRLYVENLDMGHDG